MNLENIPEEKPDKHQSRENNPPALLGRINELQRQIDELKRSWPAHSVPAAMLQRLEELEDEMEKEKRNTTVV